MAINLFDTLSPKAAFAAKLLASAGLNLDEIIAKGDVNALKLHLESSRPADLAAAINEATAKLQQDNATLTTQLAELNKKLGEITEGRAALAAILTPLTASLETAGVKLEACNDDQGKFSPEKFKLAHEFTVTKSARAMVARAGHPGLLDEIAADPTKQIPAEPKPTEQKKPELTGRARMEADFNAQLTRRYQRENPGRN